MKKNTRIRRTVIGVRDVLEYPYDMLEDGGMLIIAWLMIAVFIYLMIKYKPSSIVAIGFLIISYTCILAVPILLISIIIYIREYKYEKDITNVKKYNIMKRLIKASKKLNKDENNKITPHDLHDIIRDTFMGGYKDTNIFSYFNIPFNTSMLYEITSVIENFVKQMDSCIDFKPNKDWIIFVALNIKGIDDTYNKEELNKLLEDRYNDNKLRNILKIMLNNKIKSKHIEVGIPIVFETILNEFKYTDDIKKDMNEFLRLKTKTVYDKLVKKLHKDNYYITLMVVKKLYEKEGIEHVQ